MISKKETHFIAETFTGTVEMKGASFSWKSRAWAGVPDAQATNPNAPSPISPKRGILRQLRGAKGSPGSHVSLSPSAGSKSPLVTADVYTHITLRAPIFRIEPGQLVGVCGEVGCGKSSLLAALLGELQPIPQEGYVVGEAIRGAPVVTGSVAYCQQIPWIEAGTVRFNITFGAQFVSSWYKAVLSACALDHDISQFPNGDETEIGERGINLSGGQKSRLALARAAYSRHQVCLLDDPLSAVDPRVAQTLFTRCIGPQGLMQCASPLRPRQQGGFLPLDGDWS
jgi:ATP-binding cassette, subfamily C (CFTR/MRP), member 1